MRKTLVVLILAFFCWAHAGPMAWNERNIDIPHLSYLLIIEPFLINIDKVFTDHLKIKFHGQCVYESYSSLRWADLLVWAAKQVGTTYNAYRVSEELHYNTVGDCFVAQYFRERIPGRLVTIPFKSLYETGRVGFSKVKVELPFSGKIIDVEIVWQPPRQSFVTDMVRLYKDINDIGWVSNESWLGLFMLRFEKPIGPGDLWPAITKFTGDSFTLSEIHITNHVETAKGAKKFLRDIVHLIPPDADCASKCEAVTFHVDTDIRIFSKGQPVLDSNGKPTGVHVRDPFRIKGRLEQPLQVKPLPEGVQ